MRCQIQKYPLGFEWEQCSAVSLAYYWQWDYHSLSELVISQKCLQADRLVLSVIPEASEFS